MMLKDLCGPIQSSLARVEKELNKRTDHKFDVFANGKRLRPVLTLYAAHAFDRTHDNQATIAATAMEIIHTASLIHDDIVDSSEERRERPTLHRTIGTKSAVAFGDYLFAQGLAMVESLRTSNITSLAVGVIEAMCEGQWMEQTIGKKASYTEKDYFDIVERKTVSLFECCCKIGGILRRAGKEELELLSDFGRYFGFSYQLLDDAADLSEDRCNPNGQRIFELGGKDYYEGLARGFTVKAKDAILGLSSETERDGFGTILSYIWR